MQANDLRNASAARYRLSQRHFSSSLGRAHFVPAGFRGVADVDLFARWALYSPTALSHTSAFSSPG